MVGVNIKAVILVGGPQKGTRFRPLSLECPKPLFPIAGFATIQHHIEALAKIKNMTEILIMGFYDQKDIVSFIDAKRKEFDNVHMRYLQEFTSLGTAGGLYHFRDQILMGDPSTILVVNCDVVGDIPYTALLERATGSANASCTVLTTEATREQSINYGCCVVDDATKVVQHYVDKPSTYISTTISCGIYAIAPSMFDHLASAFKRRSALVKDKHRDSDIDAPETLWFERDIFPHLVGSGELYAYHTKQWWSQIKTAGAAIYANRHMLSLYQQTIPERLAVGDNIRGNVHIHPRAVVDPTAVIGPNVAIGADCVVEAGARIRESIILDSARVHAHACVLHSVIGWASQVGAWARVEGTPLGVNPNIPFAKMENRPLFNSDGRLNPAITILGREVQVPKETILLNSIVLPHKELSASCKNQIVL